MPPLSDVRRRPLRSVRVRGSLCGGDECRFSAGLRALIGRVHGANGNLRGTVEAENHASEDGEGCECYKAFHFSLQVNRLTGFDGVRETRMGGTVRCDTDNVKGIVIAGARIRCGVEWMRCARGKRARVLSVATAKSFPQWLKPGRRGAAYVGPKGPTPLKQKPPATLRGSGQAVGGRYVNRGKGQKQVPRVARDDNEKPGPRGHFVRFALYNRAPMRGVAGL